MAQPDNSLSPSVKRQYVLPLNNPPVVPVDEASHMRPDDVVACILVDGLARAYPWWIISNYHVVNDSVIPVRERGVEGSAGRHGSGEHGAAPRTAPTPVLLTICEACTGTSAFLPLTEGYEDPLVFTFCERSKERYSARGIYTVADVQTQSRWHPLVGKAHEGAFEGKRLTRIPVHTLRWEDWVRSYPESEVVLASAEMRRRHHVANLPHPLDREAGHTDMLKAIHAGDVELDTRAPAGELILGMTHGSDSIAVTHTYLAMSGNIRNVVYKGAPIVLHRVGRYSALSFHRDHEGEVLEFRSGIDCGGSMVDQFGREWNAFGQCVTDEGLPDLRIYQSSYSTKWGDWSFANKGSQLITEYDLANSQLDS